jgi:hypothetical protein
MTHKLKGYVCSRVSVQHNLSLDSSLECSNQSLTSYVQNLLLDFIETVGDEKQSLPGGKALWCEADQSLPYSAKIKLLSCTFTASYSFIAFTETVPLPFSSYQTLFITFHWIRCAEKIVCMLLVVTNILKGKLKYIYLWSEKLFKVFDTLSPMLIIK